MNTILAVLIVIRAIDNRCISRRRKSKKSGLISEEATQMDSLISSDLSSEQPTPEDLLSEQPTQQAESTQSQSESEGSNIWDTNDQSPATVEGPGLNAISWCRPPGFVFTQNSLI